MPDSITINNVLASQALEFKQQLDTAGLILNQDYSWRYHASKYKNEWSRIPSSVTFEFENPTLASFYRIKWAK